MNGGWGAVCSRGNLMGNTGQLLLLVLVLLCVSQEYARMCCVGGWVGAGLPAKVCMPTWVG